MPVLKYSETKSQQVREGLERKIVHLKNLMTVVLDFTDGPWAEPEPFHSHSHEQTSYVAEGEILFFCEGESEQHLQAGDLFYVPSGREHSIRLLTKKVRLVDNFSPVREDFLSE